MSGHECHNDNFKTNLIATTKDPAVELKKILNQAASQLHHNISHLSRNIAPQSIPPPDVNKLSETNTSPLGLGKNSNVNGIETVATSGQQETRNTATTMTSQQDVFGILQQSWSNRYGNRSQLGKHDYNDRDSLSVTTPISAFSFANDGNNVDEKTNGAIDNINGGSGGSNDQIQHCHTLPVVSTGTGSGSSGSSGKGSNRHRAGKSDDIKATITPLLNPMNIWSGISKFGTTAADSISSLFKDVNELFYHGSKKEDYDLMSQILDTYKQMQQQANDKNAKNDKNDKNDKNQKQSALPQLRKTKSNPNVLTSKRPLTTLNINLKTMDNFDINMKHGRKGYTALHVACQRLNFRIIKLLINNGASINIWDNSKILNPLFMLLSHNKNDIIAQDDTDYKDSGSNVDESKTQSSIKMKGKDEKDKEKEKEKENRYSAIPKMVVFLYGKSDRNPSIFNTENINGDTPLHFACINNHINVVKYMCQLNINYKQLNCCILNKKGFSALHICALKGHHECMRYICEYSENLNIDLDIRMRSLGSSSSHPDHPVASPQMQKLSRGDSDTKTDDSGDHEALDPQQIAPHTYSILNIINKGEQIDNELIMTPILESIVHCHVECFHLLLNNGAEIVDGKPLVYACIHCHNKSSTKLMNILETLLDCESIRGDYFKAIIKDEIKMSRFGNEHKINALTAAILIENMPIIRLLLGKIIFDETKMYSYHSLEYLENIYDLHKMLEKKSLTLDRSIHDLDSEKKTKDGKNKLSLLEYIKKKGKDFKLYYFLSDIHWACKNRNIGKIEMMLSRLSKNQEKAIQAAIKIRFQNVFCKVFFKQLRLKQSKNYANKLMNSITNTIAHSIANKLPFSEDLLILAWKYCEENKMESKLLSILDTALLHALSHKNLCKERDSLWMRHYFENSTIWFQTIGVNNRNVISKAIPTKVKQDARDSEQFELYSRVSQTILKLSNADANSESMKTSLTMFDIIEETAKNELKQYTSRLKLQITNLVRNDKHFSEIMEFENYTHPKFVKESLRQDNDMIGNLPDYSENELKRIDDQTFDNTKEYETKIYLNKLLIISRTMNETFQNQVKTMINKFNPNASFQAAPVKEENRCVIKSQTDYGEARWPRVARLADLIRCSITFDNSDELLAAVKHFQTEINDKSKDTGCILDILRIKNGFASIKKWDPNDPNDARYCDIKFNISICDKYINKRIIGEIQFLLKFVLDIKKKMHSLYEILRRREFVDDVNEQLGLQTQDPLQAQHLNSEYNSRHQSMVLQLVNSQNYLSSYSHKHYSSYINDILHHKKTFLLENEILLDIEGKLFNYQPPPVPSALAPAASATSATSAETDTPHGASRILTINTNDTFYDSGGSTRSVAEAPDTQLLILNSPVASQSPQLRALLNKQLYVPGSGQAKLLTRLCQLQWVNACELLLANLIHFNNYSQNYHHSLKNQAAVNVVEEKAENKNNDDDKDKFIVQYLNYTDNVRFDDFFGLSSQVFESKTMTDVNDLSLVNVIGVGRKDSSQEKYINLMKLLLTNQYFQGIKNDNLIYNCVCNNKFEYLSLIIQFRNNKHDAGIIGGINKEFSVINNSSKSDTAPVNITPIGKLLSSSHCNPEWIQLIESIEGFDSSDPVYVRKTKTRTSAKTNKKAANINATTAPIRDQSDKVEDLLNDGPDAMTKTVSYQLESGPLD